TTRATAYGAWIHPMHWPVPWGHESRGCSMGTASGDGRVTFRSPVVGGGLRGHTICVMRRLLRATMCAFFGLGLVGCGGGGAAESTVDTKVSSEPPEPTAFEKVLEYCEVPVDALGDGGKTLQLDGAGKDDRKYRDGEMVTSPR